MCVFVIRIPQNIGSGETKIQTYMYMKVCVYTCVSTFMCMCVPLGLKEKILFISLVYGFHRYAYSYISGLMYVDRGVIQTNGLFFTCPNSCLYKSTIAM